MFSLLKSVFANSEKGNELKILIIGEHEAGKTSLFNLISCFDNKKKHDILNTKLIKNNNSSVNCSLGFNTKSINFEKKKLKIYDLEGTHSNTVDIYDCYYDDIDVIFYVIDSKSEKHIFNTIIYLCHLHKRENEKSFQNEIKIQEENKKDSITGQGEVEVVELEKKTLEEKEEKKEEENDGYNIQRVKPTVILANKWGDSGPCFSAPCIYNYIKNVNVYENDKFWYFVLSSENYFLSYYLKLLYEKVFFYFVKNENSFDDFLDKEKMNERTYLDCINKSKSLINEIKKNNKNFLSVEEVENNELLTILMKNIMNDFVKNYQNISIEVFNISIHMNKGIYEVLEIMFEKYYCKKEEAIKHKNLEITKEDKEENKKIKNTNETSGNEYNKEKNKKELQDDSLQYNFKNFDKISSNFIDGTSKENKEDEQKRTLYSNVNNNNNNKTVISVSSLSGSLNDCVSEKSNMLNQTFLKGKSGYTNKKKKYITHYSNNTNELYKMQKHSLHLFIEYMQHVHFEKEVNYEDAYNEMLIVISASKKLHKNQKQSSSIWGKKERKKLCEKVQKTEKNIEEIDVYDRREIEIKKALGHDEEAKKEKKTGNVNEEVIIPNIKQIGKKSPKENENEKSDKGKKMEERNKRKSASDHEDNKEEIKREIINDLEDNENKIKKESANGHENNKEEIKKEIITDLEDNENKIEKESVNDYENNKEEIKKEIITDLEDNENKIEKECVNDYENNKEEIKKEIITDLEDNENKIKKESANDREDNKEETKRDIVSDRKDNENKIKRKYEGDQRYNERKVGNISKENSNEKNFDVEDLNEENKSEKEMKRKISMSKSEEENRNEETNNENRINQEKSGISINIYINDINDDVLCEEKEDEDEGEEKDNKSCNISYYNDTSNECDKIEQQRNLNKTKTKKMDIDNSEILNEKYINTICNLSSISLLDANRVLKLTEKGEDSCKNVSKKLSQKYFQKYSQEDVLLKELKDVNCKCISEENEENLQEEVIVIEDSNEDIDSEGISALNEELIKAQKITDIDGVQKYYEDSNIHNANTSVKNNESIANCSYYKENNTTYKKEKKHTEKIYKHRISKSRCMFIKKKKKKKIKIVYQPVVSTSDESSDSFENVNIINCMYLDTSAKNYTSSKQ